MGRTKVPSYRHYKPKNLGFVEIDGKRKYFGQYDDPKTKQKYDRYIAEWLANDLSLRKTRPVLVVPCAERNSTVMKCSKSGSAVGDGPSGR